VTHFEKSLGFSTTSSSTLGKQVKINSGLWELLSRDVALFGGLQSPLLSWFGACGILLFFLWHILKLHRETGTVRRAFDRIRPGLITLVKERGDSNGLFPHSAKKFITRLGREASSSTRIDCDDLAMLDRALQQEPLFRVPWTQYQLTLVLEHVPWFVEPRIFSTKPAGEVFTRETIFTKHLNVAFYRQFPSLITGIGLLLTFLALFIGLGKLHAEGNEIVGIQGLINGLAGKFLTSIVGLIVANVFTFTEKPMMARVTNAHQQFLNLLDQLFPRKTMEQMLEQLTAIQSNHPGERSASGGEVREYIESWENKSLAIPTDNLTAAIQSLNAWQQEHAEARKMTADLPRMMKAELYGPLNDLTDAIHHLIRLLKDSTHHPFPTETFFDERPLLWKAAPSPRPFSLFNFLQKITAWPRWPRPSRQRRTG
jgi:hypothetical protein